MAPSCASRSVTPGSAPTKGLIVMNEVCCCVRNAPWAGRLARQECRHKDPAAPRTPMGWRVHVIAEKVRRGDAFSP